MNIVGIKKGAISAFFFNTEANYLAALASAAAGLASAAGLAAGAAFLSALAAGALASAAGAAKAFNESANKPATNEANNLDM